MSATLTIPGLALEAARRWPLHTALIDGARRWSFEELAVEMRGAAAAFVQAGLARGERVAVWMPNCAEMIIACLGIQAAGGIVVPLNTRFRAQEAAYILNRSRAALIVAYQEFLGTRYDEIISGLELRALRRTVYVGDQGSGWQDFLQAATAQARALADERLARLRPDDVADIMFTSGTTGEPKGVVTTHQQTVKTAYLWARATTLSDSDRFLILWPFFHCAGYKAGWVACLAAGATVLPEARLDVPQLMSRVERERVTFLPGPPTLFQSILASTADRSALGSVRVSITGAASVAPSMIEAMRGELGIATVLTGYGLTETCGTVTMTNPQDRPEVIVTSCGRALEGLEVAIVDSTGQPQLCGGPGEVVVRGMNVMQGYLDDPAATAEAIDAAGWLHTGDIGTLDEAGYLRITDRKKDMFIVGGFNCYPAEIEKMLLAHPAIQQVAVVGLPDTRLGEVARAYVVLKPHAHLDVASLIEWSRERMANYKVPRSVIFTAQLPTNATGKVQKFKLESP
jgi:acyl-CoA synthetase (AMP-forming)/AMP-acid ligase II